MKEFYVKVKPNSSELRIEEDTIPKVYLTEPAENGRANSELLDFMESFIGQKPAIVSGHSSRRKKLRVSISDDEELPDFLNECR